ncbi:hypothetical protein FLY21_22200 [Escherichia coli]|nr:hypothetical protein [Escherichia coli]EEW3541030.1 hypothetical protein [Escherichia coli]EEW4972572.1 hypothetical protein [Escherichia coli]EEY5370759.1 hypothetical protein [Escherichia coli]EEY6205937.1 hypothetical protein [Escherichia coli]
MSIFCACPVHGKHVFIFFIWLTCRETGHGSRKIFINSENPRGRRPVTCRIAGKDSQNDNNYHLHVTTCIYAIKPRQIINYDAGIVLIDLHQINVKATSDNTNQQH